MHDSNKGFQDFVEDNFTPLAILIDDKGNVKKINEAGSLFFDQSKNHINDIFSKVFLDVFESIFGECRKYKEALRVPVLNVKCFFCPQMSVGEKTITNMTLLSENPTVLK